MLKDIFTGELVMVNGVRPAVGIYSLKHLTQSDLVYVARIIMRHDVKVGGVRDNATVWLLEPDPNFPRYTVNLVAVTLSTWGRSISGVLPYVGIPDY